MIECDYSFEMLYKAAYKKKIPDKIKHEFQALPQEEINKLVMKWAQVANWRTESKVGEQGVVYLAFYP
jgi:hypothetical protein